MTKIRSGSSGRVRDRRGSGGGGGGAFGGAGGFPIPMKAGGGIVGIIVLVAIVLITQLGGGDGAGAPGLGAQSGAVDDGGDGGGEVACETELEQVVCGAVDDVSLYWEGQFPVSFQGAFSGTDTVFFSGSTQTGCGGATSQTGPF